MSETSGIEPPHPAVTDASGAQPEQPVAHPLDLDRIETDLADVEIALARLDSGEYWRDQVTGEPLDDSLLADQPTARRAVDTNL